MGVVLNRPSGVTVGDAVPPLAEIADEDDLVYVGGPVQEDAVIVLAEFADPDRAASIVFSDVGFVPGEIEDPDDLGRLPRSRVFAGYAGWVRSSSRPSSRMMPGSLRRQNRRRLHERPRRSLAQCASSPWRQQRNPCAPPGRSPRQLTRRRFRRISERDTTQS